MADVPGLVFSGLSSGMVYVLIALGLTLVFSIMGVINFAHGEFYMAGAYIVYFFTVERGINYWAAIPLAIVLVGLLGAAVDRGLLRRVGRELIPTALITLGLTLILQVAALYFFGAEFKAIPSPIPGVIRSTYLAIPKEELGVIGISVALILAILFLIYRTKLGRAMRAVTQDREAAALQGIDVENVSTMGFALGSGLAAIAGALMGAVFFLTPFMGQAPLIKALAIIVLGGMGSIPGAVAGGLIMGQVESFATFYINPQAGELAFFAIIILILLLRPRGLLGTA